MQTNVVVAALIGALALAGCQKFCPTPRAAVPALDPNGMTHAQLLAEARKDGPRDCSKDDKFMFASSSLGTAIKQMKLRDFRRANIALRDGLEEIGYIRLGSDVIDDTGLQASFGYSLDWNGDLEQAAIQR